MIDSLDQFNKYDQQDIMNDGMSLLRKYMFYCNFDLSEIRTRYDELKNGSIQEKVLKQVLDNFEILIAKKFSILALPQLEFSFIAQEKIEIALYQYFGVQKNQKIFPYLMKEQFNQLLKVKLPNIELTLDEKALLYFLIRRKSETAQFNVVNVINWIISMRGYAFKQIMHLYEDEQEGLELLQVPKILKQFQFMAQRYSTAMLKQAFLPFQNEEELCTIENLKIVLRSLEIGFTQIEFNEFRYYLAKQGLFMLTKQQQLLLKVKEFLQNLNPVGFKELEEVEFNNTEKAYQTLFQSIILSLLNNYDDQAQKLMQYDQYLDEMSLRKIFCENLTQFDQNSLTIILKSLEHNQEPSIKSPLRMIYFPELIEKLKARFTDKILLPQPALIHVEKKVNSEIKSNIDFTEGKFIRDPIQAFQVKQLDDREILQKLKYNLQQHFNIQGKSEFEKTEKVICQLSVYLQNFDQLKTGNISQEILYDILGDITQLNQYEKNNIVDFAIGISKTEDSQISYMFFCIQLNEFYQKHQLISTKDK